MADNFRTIIKTAEGQGWRVEGPGSAGRYTFYSPDGQAIVTTPASPTAPRAHANAVSQLRRAGMDIPRSSPKPKSRTQEDEPMDTETAPSVNGHGPSIIETARALDAVVEMLNELADEFAKFRKATIDSLTELRGQVRTMQGAKFASIEQVEAVTREFDARLVALQKGLDTKLSDIEQRADPIGAFREKMRR